MADPTREEIDAKLAATEARIETKLASIDGKIDRIGDRLSDLGTQMRETRTAAEDAKRAASSTKWNILFSALGSLAVLLALWAVWVQGIEMATTLLSSKTPPAASSPVSPPKVSRQQ